MDRVVMLPSHGLIFTGTFPRKAPLFKEISGPSMNPGNFPPFLPLLNRQPIVLIDAKTQLGNRRRYDQTAIRIVKRKY